VVLLSLRSYCFGQLLNNDMVFFQKNKVGHLLTVFTVDLETIRSMLTKTLFTVLKNLSRLVTTLGLLAYLSPKLTMLLLSTG
jgi:ABC-type multidrug transport system fused ATPase/permease subunit